MLKETRKEYVIKRCGYYMKEHEEVGMFYTTNDVKLATEFGSLESTISYIENDLRLNLANVSIHEIKTEITETPLVFINGNFIHIKPIEYFYYGNQISKDEDTIKEYIAENCYTNEEGLMLICENEIYEINTLDELKKWCEEQGEDWEDYIEEVK